MAYMSTMTVSEARSALPDVLDRVERGEEVTITRHGRAVAVVVRPDALRSRRAEQALAAAERIRSALVAGRKLPLHTAGISAARADELVGAVRSGRDVRR
jgi:prevent-host-death family protein